MPLGTHGEPCWMLSSESATIYLNKVWLYGVLYCCYMHLFSCSKASVGNKLSIKSDSIGVSYIAHHSVMVCEGLMINNFYWWIHFLFNHTIQGQFRSSPSPNTFIPPPLTFPVMIIELMMLVLLHVLAFVLLLSNQPILVLVHKCFHF